MITIDAPLYPLLLVEKAAKVESENGAQNGAAKSGEEIAAPALKTEEMYSWQSYVRNNFAPPMKGKKKGDLWKKLETYRKVSRNIKKRINKNNIFQ
jgi:hypothetical protein